MTAWGRHWPALALTAALVLASPLVVSSPVRVDTATIMAIYAVIALSAGLVYGHAGILSVGQAAFASLGAYVTAIGSTRYQLSPWLMVFGAVIVPSLVGYLLARLVAHLSPLALSIATLAFSKLVEIAERGGGNFTGGYIGISGIPPAPGFTEPLVFLGMAWGVVIVLIMLLTNLTSHSAWGRALHSIRHDALRAAADGIDVGRARALVMALAGGIAGLGGWIYAHQLSYLAPEALNASTSISVLLMAVIGGVRTVLGPVLGTAVIVLLLTNIPAQEIQGMLYGALLIAVLLLAPNGIAGLPWSAWTKATLGAVMPASSGLMRASRWLSK